MAIENEIMATKFQDDKHGLCIFCAHFEQSRALEPCSICEWWFGKKDNWEKADGTD